MNKEELHREIAKVLPEVLERAGRTKQANQMVPISGTRYKLPLEGRKLDIAYYSTGKPGDPLVIGLHGGGFLFGGSALDDELWTNVVKVLDVNVASIDYRMSPDVMDDDCLNDVYDSILYMKEHSDEYGFDNGHISVFGSSAGGNLAAAVCILAAKKKEYTLDNQILMYPFLDGFTDPDEKGEGSFTGVLPHIMNKLHFSPERADDPLLSPYYADKDMLTGLPNAIVAYCEDDNLRKEAEEYCSHLKEAFVPVSAYFARRMPHGYIEAGFKEKIDPVTRQILGEHADELVETGLLRKTSVETLEFVRDHFIR